MSGVTPFMDFSRRRLRIRNEYIKGFLGEFLGTAILVFFGVGGGIQHALAGGTQDSMQPILGSLFGLMAAILIVGGASGGHINPAVTLGQCIVGNCSWIKLPLYWVAQFLGGYIGCGLAMGLYAWARIIPGEEGDSFYQRYPPGVLVPTGLTTPIGIGFLDQIIGTSILVMLIVAVCDKRNMKVPPALVGFFICLTIAGIGMCFGTNAGAVLNPARDFSARLMALTVGYDSKLVMTRPDNSHWWTVGFFGPLIGGALGAVVYVLLIGAHLNDAEDDEKEVKDKSGEDWRSTRFMPKAQIQPPPNGQNNNGNQYQPPSQQQQYNNGNNNNNNYAYAGSQNQGYAGDDMRNRQGY